MTVPHQTDLGRSTQGTSHALARPPIYIYIINKYIKEPQNLNEKPVRFPCLSKDPNLLQKKRGPLGSDKEQGVIPSITFRYTSNAMRAKY